MITRDLQELYPRSVSGLVCTGNSNSGWSLKTSRGRGKYHLHRASSPAGEQSVKKNRGPSFNPFLTEVLKLKLKER